MEDADGKDETDPRLTATPYFEEPPEGTIMDIASILLLISGLAFIFGCFYLLGK